MSNITESSEMFYLSFLFHKSNITRLHVGASTTQIGCVVTYEEESRLRSSVLFTLRDLLITRTYCSIISLPRYNQIKPIDYPLCADLSFNVLS